jgi:ApbE superfamily uncharacterized protein (UPF0280 family)
LTAKPDDKSRTDRGYRRLVRSRLTPMQVKVQETDLCVYADGLRPDEIKAEVIRQRGYVEGYIQRFPEFARTLVPWPEDSLAPPIVQDMIQAGCQAGVGPMAAVAGAVAERVGRYLLAITDQIIIENGGDIFVHVHDPLTVAVYAGRSPLSLTVGLEVAPAGRSSAVCTSSGTVGHSLSQGLADAVCVLSGSCALADAAATAIGNRVRGKTDIQSAIDWGRTIAGIEGILVIIGDRMGMWGRVQLKPLRQPRPEKKVEF